MADEFEIYQRQGQRIAASDVLAQIGLGRQIMLEKCTISGDLDVSRVLVKEEEFDISGLKVEDAGGCSRITIDRIMSFRSCLFEGNVSFSAPWEKPEAIRVVFAKDAIFNSSEFGGQTRFSDTDFLATAGFDGCTFRHVTDFRRVNFKANALYRTAEFCGYGLFSESVFESGARFTNTCFTRGGNFTEVRFEGVTDFSGVYARSKSVPVYESVHFSRHTYGDDESFWRFIKQSAQEAGYYQLAGESFYMERCAHFWKRFRGNNYDELSAAAKILRWIAGVKLLPELIFGRLLFGYGERPIRVLFASAAVVILCAIFYASPYSNLEWRIDSHISQPGFIDGLYFSTITFTTLGFGDIYPSPDHLLTRCVAMFEALCGASLMALYVVTLSKRYSRG